MELKDTIEMMNSEDYKERFKAEFYQTKIRYLKLCDVIKKYEEGTLDFKLVCPIDLLKEQAAHMFDYLYVLEDRANLEGIEDLRIGDVPTLTTHYSLTLNDYLDSIRFNTKQKYMFKR